MVYGDLVEKTTLYLPGELQRALRDEARRSGRPQAALVRDALRAYLSSRTRPSLTSLGLGEDPELSAREAEEWLDTEWSRR